jgi:hypothetical protein
MVYGLYSYGLEMWDREEERRRAGKGQAMFTKTDRIV